MGRKGTILVVCLAVLAVGVIAIDSAQASPRARGIVKEIAGGGDGQILVTDPEVFAGPVRAGDTVSFLEDVRGLGIDAGDYVEFAIGPGPDPVATDVALVSKGTIITSTREGPLTVAANQAVTVQGSATIVGKVTVNGGALYIVGGAHIDGKIESGGGSMIIGAARVDGSVVSGGNSILVLRGSTIDGKVVSNGDRFVQITGATIGGKLEVLTLPTAGCSATNNTVTGKVDVPAGCN